MNSLRVLVTNDDGIDSPGLIALARCAVELGHETIIAAPSVEASGTGAGLTASGGHRQVALSRRTIEELPGVPAYAVDSHPGLIALLACRGAFGGRPDLVLSGINFGANIGRALIHSGTVGAALTAHVNGITALAVSLDVHWDPPGTPLWDVVDPYVKDVLGFIEPGTVLNLNVPNRPDPGPLRWATLTRYGRVQSRIVNQDDDVIELQTVILDDEVEPDSDAGLLEAGYATVTELRSVSAVERPRATPPR
ncbi:5'/3'-nucleotidase SurE [Kutzneria buriramensis]|uniref:5'-nucleotidase n=1 Tax=Kutzneria buriramensis TaxID=1045776 RepID=A0A3E0IB35_9PSEU|nr:5'/3'-nucleotidase SurE [Kutzneria buriramensis]REH55880.1 5'-nucleotidase [Kutzneria buriramensis]